MAVTALGGFERVQTGAMLEELDRARGRSIEFRFLNALYALLAR
jgi:hypothetical protein